MSDQSLIKDINSLLQPRRRKELKPAEPRGALGGQRAVADYSASNPTEGGGIASPLTEQSREYWPGGVPSSDGLFTLPAIKTWVFTDANGAEVVMAFADPVTP
ncbi:hypothetical protein EA796_00955 [Pseudomonas sp. AOB-7]|uniref:hypothetical protein n=1 Tax=Pseudomonas sp. AOB-7 TaxID=2482750 RepID=UPI000EFCF945|nr:hypothetical protein [Pseudomonas sp. AOB-7]RMH86431.1 hypothetical protein EA796_00955 [Pseudomonas sp. AOB-7]